MAKSISRRSAMLAGTATAGSLIGASCSNSQPVQTAAASKDIAPLPNVWGEDFLMQWTPPDNVVRDLTPGPSHIRLSCAGYRMRMPRDGESFGDVVKSIRDGGFTACETGGRTMNGITDSQIRELKAALTQHDVEFYGIHVWTNIIHPDATQATENIQQVVNAVETAERLGLKFILTHTGGNDPDNKDRPHPQNWSKATWEKSVAATKQILSDTAGSAINLAFEAVNSCNQNTPQSHVRLKQDVGDERVKVTLDPTNMYHPGVLFRNSELLNTCFELLGEDIMYAHAKDSTWTSMVPGIIEGATLGEGVQDFALYLAHLSRMKSPRCLLIEHMEHDQYPPSRQFLIDTAERIGVKIYS